MPVSCIAHGLFLKAQKIPGASRHRRGIRARCHSERSEESQSFSDCCRTGPTGTLRFAQGDISGMTAGFSLVTKLRLVTPTIRGPPETRGLPSATRRRLSPPFPSEKTLHSVPTNPRFSSAKKMVKIPPARPIIWHAKKTRKMVDDNAKICDKVTRSCTWSLASR